MLSVTDTELPNENTLKEDLLLIIAEAIVLDCVSQ